MYLHEFRNWKTWLSVNYHRCDWAFSFLAVMKGDRSKSCFRSCPSYKCAFKTGLTSKQWLMRICVLVGSIQPLFIVPIVLWLKSAPWAGTFSDGDPAFCGDWWIRQRWNILMRRTGRCICRNIFIQSEIIVIPPRCFSILLKIVTGQTINPASIRLQLNYGVSRRRG